MVDSFFFSLPNAADADAVTLRRGLVGLMIMRPSKFGKEIRKALHGRKTSKLKQALATIKYFIL